MSDPLVKKYVSEDLLPTSRQSSVRAIQYWIDLYKYRRSIYWGLALKSNDYLIGTCGFDMWSYVHQKVEVSYDLSRKFWNQGIMTQAVRTICDFAFCTLKANRIQATVVIDNVASIKLLEKLKFQREGIMRDYGILHGEKKDSYMYSLLAKDIEF